MTVAVVVVTLAGATHTAHADEATRVHHDARADGVYAGDRRLWVGRRGERVVSDVRWSRQRDAVAFVTWGSVGGAQLVVVVVRGPGRGQALRWWIPVRGSWSRRPARRATVTWLGRSRVAYAPGGLRPTLVASWTVR